MDALRPIVSFFELLGTYACFRLWAPVRSCNKDLISLGIPIVTDNMRNDYIPKRSYATSQSTSWTLRELAVRNLANNLIRMSRHCKGDSAIWSLTADKTSRYPPPQSTLEGEGIWGSLSATRGSIAATLISEKKSRRKSRRR